MYHAIEVPRQNGGGGRKNEKRNKSAGGMRAGGNAGGELRGLGGICRGERTPLKLVVLMN